MEITPESSPADILKRRLASGEISIEQFRVLMAEVDSRQSRGAPDRATSTQEMGRLIFEFEDLKLFEHAILYKEICAPLSDVTSVSGGQSKNSINFVPMHNSSSIHIGLLYGQVISISEDRVIFGGKRHEAIGRLLATIRQLTFKQRLTNLAKKLIQNGMIELTKQVIFRGEKLGETIVLTKDGVVVCGDRKIALKTAKALGTFGLGSEWHSLNFMSQRSNPSEVVLSEQKGIVGAMIPFGALRFVPSVYDIDIAHALLAWLAEPKNILH